MRLPTGLDLEQCDEGPHLFLNGLQSDQSVELGLHLRQWPGRPGPGTDEIADQVVHALRTRQLELIGQMAYGFAQFVEWMPAGSHVSTVVPDSRSGGVGATTGRPYAATAHTANDTVLSPRRCRSQRETVSDVPILPRLIVDFDAGGPSTPAEAMLTCRAVDGFREGEQPSLAAP